MKVTVGGVLTLGALIAAPVGVLALSVRRRPPAEVVTGGPDGLSIHPWRGHPVVLVVGWVFVAALAVLGVSYLPDQPYAAAFCLVGAALMAYAGWTRATGRLGDGTLTFTPEGLHQLYGGSEVLVPWDDVRGLVTTPTDLIVETTRPVVPVRRTLPINGRRGVVLDDAIGLPWRHLPPLPYVEMIELYATSPVARDELATDEPVRRTRELLEEWIADHG